MSDLFPSLGLWFWWVIAAFLLILELIAPASFFLWFAIAAGVMGSIALFVPLSFGQFSWAVELFTFTMLSSILLYPIKKWLVTSRQPFSDRPHLNQRMYDYVGKSYFLHEPIREGSGKLLIQGALWDIDGPDLPKGTRVRVVDVDGLVLKIEADT